MTFDMYRQIIIDHAKQPHNFGPLPHADGQSEKDNPLCGDRIQMMYRLDKTKKKLQQVHFDGAGCSIARAAASILTDTVTGKTVAQLKRYSDDQFIADMGVPITPARRKCALLALQTLRRAANVEAPEKK
ncbi:MAG: iron-sulfur cluster assembly scaffold protein [Patescibacteria group bacterium]